MNSPTQFFIQMSKFHGRSQRVSPKSAAVVSLFCFFGVLALWENSEKPHLHGSY